MNTVITTSTGWTYKTKTSNVKYLERLQARNAELKNRIAEYEIGFADSVVKNEEENSLMFWVNMITRTNEEIMANDIEARRLKLVIANWGK